MHPAYDGYAALPYYDEFDLSTVDVLLISQYVASSLIRCKHVNVGAFWIEGGTDDVGACLHLPNLSATSTCTSDQYNIASLLLLLLSVFFGK